MDAVREAENPSLNAILFRESYPQLSDIRRKCRRLLTGGHFGGNTIPATIYGHFHATYRRCASPGSLPLLFVFFTQL
jgi:hypothetical protein